MSDFPQRLDEMEGEREPDTTKYLSIIRLRKNTRRYISGLDQSNICAGWGGEGGGAVTTQLSGDTTELIVEIENWSSPSSSEEHKKCRINSLKEYCLTRSSRGEKNSSLSLEVGLDWPDIMQSWTNNIS